jgi:RNA polymerase sigma-70 factor, ECF subfamily
VPSDPETTALVCGVRDGDEASFARFYGHYEAAVHRTALALLRDPMAAQDVVLETFVRAHRARARLDPARSPLPWLQHVALNLARTELQRRSRGASALPEPEEAAWPDPGLTPEAAALASEQAADLALAIVGLPEPQRLVVVLRYLHDLALADIAVTLGCPVGTVKSRLHGGLGRLRDALSGPAREPERTRVPAAAGLAVTEPLSRSG